MGIRYHTDNLLTTFFSQFLVFYILHKYSFNILCILSLRIFSADFLQSIILSRIFRNFPAFCETCIQCALEWSVYPSSPRYVDWIRIQCYMGWCSQELVKLKLDEINIDDWYMTGGMKTDAGKQRIVPIHTKIPRVHL